MIQKKTRVKTLVSDKIDFKAKITFGKKNIRYICIEMGASLMARW